MRGIMLLAVALLGLLPCGSLAQYFRSQISGFVRDPSAAVIADATVVLEAPAIALKRTVPPSTHLPTGLRRSRAWIT